MTYKIEVTFKSEHRALQFKGDMLNLEAYDIVMGPIVALNCNGAPEVNANPNSYGKDEPETDYPDGDEG